MAKIIETFEYVTLVSVEQVADMPSHEWDWRCQFVGCNSLHRRKSAQMPRRTLYNANR